MRSLATETKVGIFVVLGIIILTYFTVRVGRIAVREVGYRVYTHVESAAGLDKNSQVRIAGVEVGKVEEIILEGTKARVTMHLPINVKIPAGSKVYVKSSGLLGEKYIEISPGPGPEFVKPGEKIAEGAPAIDVDRVLAQLSAIGTDVKSVTQSLSQALGGEEGERSVKELVSSAKKTLVAFQNIAQSIEKGDGTIGKLVKDESLYLKTKETIAEAKETLANLNKVSKQIESGEGTLGKLVKDDSLYVQTKETIAEAKETLANLNKVSKQIESGEGTLGKLVKDETLYDDTKKAIKSINKAAEGIQEVTPVTVLGVILGNVIR